VPGVTMGGLVRWLKIVVRGEGQVEYEIRHARLTAMRAAETHLNRLHHEGLLSTHAWEKLQPDLARQVSNMAQAVREVLRADPLLEAEELDTAQREMFRAQRSALSGLRRDGVISDEVFETLTAEVDAALTGTVSPYLTDADETETESKD